MIDLHTHTVGGGISGLAAAGRLEKAGLKALVLEARGRLGGRMYTVQGDGGDVLELGKAEKILSLASYWLVNFSLNIVQ